MASFTTVGFEDVERMLIERSEDVQRIAPDMLKAGAKVLISAQKAELRRISRGDRSIGTLASSIGMGNVKTSNDAMKMYVDVYPQGDQPHGTPKRGKKGRVSNAQVGFTTEYGSADMPARPWMSVANEKSAPAVHEAMRKVWEAKRK